MLQQHAITKRQYAASTMIVPVLGILFFLSGMSGLIYQVLWLRKLSVVFGVTVYAASAVLAGFMGGLALGSYLAGKIADRARRPLLKHGSNSNLRASLIHRVGMTFSPSQDN